MGKSKLDSFLWEQIFQKMENKEAFLEFVKDNNDITIEKKDYPAPNDIDKVITCQKIIYIKNK